MPPSPPQLPDLQTLTAGLASVFAGHESPARPLTILAREPNVYEKSFPSEIVTCRFQDESVRRLFCKYMFDLREDHLDHGSRGGLVYEAAVYRHVLRPLQVSAPTFYGLHTDAPTGGRWLILEYLENGVQLDVSRERTAIGKAAQWIGRFHAAQEAHTPCSPVPFLSSYGAEYYRGWVRRTSLYAGRLNLHVPWLGALCERFEECVASLLAPRPTVIHGEYYPHNVLFRGGIIYPVDWESAAVAAGEIDLATLTEGRSAKVVRKCELEYGRARWPAGAPADFGRRLGAARLYVQFRWLGDHPDSITREDPLLNRLRSAGEQLGLI
jgi:Phosphotransferase enzyme family